MKLNIEIRAGEGGQDAQLLTESQAAIYAAYAKSLNIKLNKSAGLG